MTDNLDWHIVAWVVRVDINTNQGVGYLKHFNDIDHWSVFENQKEAEVEYKRLLNVPRSEEYIYCASVSKMTNLRTDWKDTSL
jgi:thioredoxin-related protein